jgi:hypothetical protein
VLWAHAGAVHAANSPSKRATKNDGFIMKEPPATS